MTHTIGLLAAYPGDFYFCIGNFPQQMLDTHQHTQLIGHLAQVYHQRYQQQFNNKPYKL